LQQVVRQSWKVYPSLWSRSFPREDRNQDQHDAYSVARWMRQADIDGSLSVFRHYVDTGGVLQQTNR
jgi:hypothetical protein